MNRVFILSAPCAAGTIVAYGRAHAQDLSSCGDIRIEAEARCEFVPPSLECRAMCTPITVEAACAAELYAECDGMCSGSIEAGCEGSCQADCSAACEVDPGDFRCEASCEADCAASCDASCAARPGAANCQASCEATCSGGCDAECDGDLPEASCDARCEASCRGSYQARADLMCQIDCQADAFVACEADIQGGCEAACMGEEGALFCDGSYVDPRDDIEACVAALEGLLAIEVSGYADASASCDGGACYAQASAGSNCSVGRGGDDRPLPGILPALGVGALCWRRRRTP